MAACSILGGRERASTPHLYRQEWARLARRAWAVCRLLVSIHPNKTGLADNCQASSMDGFHVTGWAGNTAAWGDRGSGNSAAAWGDRGSGNSAAAWDRDPRPLGNQKQMVNERVCQAFNGILILLAGLAPTLDMRTRSLGTPRRHSPKNTPVQPHTPMQPHAAPCTPVQPHTPHHIIPAAVCSQPCCCTHAGSVPYAVNELLSPPPTPCPGSM